MFHDVLFYFTYIQIKMVGWVVSENIRDKYFHFHIYIPIYIFMMRFLF